MILIWTEELVGLELEPQIYQYEVNLFDYNMSLKTIVKEPALPVRATLTMDGVFYFLSIVDSDYRNLAQFCRKM